MFHGSSSLPFHQGSGTNPPRRHRGVRGEGSNVGSVPAVGARSGRSVVPPPHRQRPARRDARRKRFGEVVPVSKSTPLEKSKGVAFKKVGLKIFLIPSATQTQTYAYPHLNL